MTQSNQTNDLDQFQFEILGRELLKNLSLGEEEVPADPFWLQAASSAYQLAAAHLGESFQTVTLDDICQYLIYLVAADRESEREALLTPMTGETASRVCILAASIVGWYLAGGSKHTVSEHHVQP